MTTTDFTRAPWRTSGFSANQGQCVEVAPVPGSVGVRDTKDRDRGHLTVTRTAWTGFAHAAARGDLVR